MVVMTKPAAWIKSEEVRNAAAEEALCQELLGRVARIRNELRNSTPESEALQKLSSQSLALLKSNNLLNMRLMEDVGGLEASLATQCKVLSALAEADSATAWCAMVHNNGVGTLAAYFPDETVAEIFAPKIPIVSFVAGPNGKAIRTADGYVITGQWRFCSGFHNADWIVCATWLDGDPTKELLIVLPKSDVTAHDTWNVFGLRGTGSIDFSVRDYAIPERHAIYNASRLQLRGNRLYGRPGILIAVYEHAAFAWGIGRRSLSTLTAQAARLGPALAGRETVAAEISRLSVELEAASALVLEYYTNIEHLTAEQSADPVVASHGRAIAAHITDVAFRCADTAFKRAGTRAAFLPNEIEMTLRDMKTAQAHILVSDAAYGIHGSAIVASQATDSKV